MPTLLLVTIKRSDKLPKVEPFTAFIDPPATAKPGRGAGLPQSKVIGHDPLTDGDAPVFVDTAMCVPPSDKFARLV